MGHIVGEEVIIAENVDKALETAKNDWERDSSFVDSYTQENIAHRISKRRIINSQDIDRFKRILKKEIATADDILKNNHPNTNSADIIPLGIFAWDRYDCNFEGKTPNAKEYKVLTGYSRDYIQNIMEDFSELKSFGNKRKSEKFAYKKAFDFAKRTRRIREINDYYSFTSFSWNNFKENYRKNSYYINDFETNKIYILNENNEVINQGIVTIERSKNKLQKLKSANKQVIPVYGYLISFDAHIG